MSSHPKKNEGPTMGRDEKRQRERVIRRLERRLRRKPSEEEVDKALAEKQRTRWKKDGRADSR